MLADAPDVVYNVIVAGTSIGLTFHKPEAERWVKSSMHPEPATILGVPYRVPDADFKRYMERPR